MLKRIIAPVLLALTVLGPLTGPALAQYGGRGIYRNDRYDRDGLGPRRAELDERADRIARRARTLHREGRLSRDHMERTLEKLDRVRNTVRSSSRIREERFRSDMEWLRDVEETMEEWSRSDSRRRFRF